MESVSTHTFLPVFALLPIIFYIVIIGSVIWFAISLIKTLKEKNKILKEIANNMKDNPGNKRD